MIDTFQIRNEAIKRVAKYKLGGDSDCLVEFAFWLIDKGIENENIYILAGLSNNDTYDKYRYFTKTIDSLNIEITENEFEIGTIYGELIENEIIENNLNAITGLDILYHLYLNQNYRSDYFWTIELSDSIDLLDEGNSWLPELTIDNKEIYIIETIKLNRVFKEIEVPKNFDKQAYCLNCNMRIEPIIYTKKTLFRKNDIHQWRCSKCNSNNLVWTRYNPGKRIYLRELGITI